MRWTGRHRSIAGLRGMEAGGTGSTPFRFVAPVKLLIDMNLSPNWTPFLTSHGWWAVRWSTIDRRSTLIWSAFFIAWARS